MPDAKVLPVRPRKYSCSFVTGSDAAVAYMAVAALRLGFRLDIREEPSDREEPPAPAPLSDPEAFSGAGVRLEL